MKKDKNGNIIRDFGPASDGTPRVYPTRKENGLWWVFRADASGETRWRCTGYATLAELREDMK